ncbi:MAG: hypothetical protein IJQ32_07600 [Paludibacteraceae bacterium]|nr:hypothetical protein [Paludibacteraceae bacterium]
MNIVHFGRIFAAVNGFASFVPLLLMGSGVGGLAHAECNLAVYLRCGFCFGCLVGILRPFFGGFYPIILQKNLPIICIYQKFFVPLHPISKTDSAYETYLGWFFFTPRPAKASEQG